MNKSFSYGFVVFHDAGNVAAFALDATTPEEAAAELVGCWMDTAPIQCSPEEAWFWVEPLTAECPEMGAIEDEFDYAMRIPTDESKRTYWSSPTLSTAKDGNHEQAIED